MASTRQHVSPPGVRQTIAPYREQYGAQYAREFIGGKMSESLMRLVDAIAFSAHEHRHQVRKDQPPTPYINHPVALLRILAVEAGVTDVDVLIAALLHDYLEDCCGDQQEGLAAGKAKIEERFGEAVLGYVCEVTDDKTLDK